MSSGPSRAFDRGDARGDRGLVRDVERADAARVMPSPASAAIAASSFVAVAAVDRDARAGLREAARDREAEAGAAAGDERDAAR